MILMIDNYDSFTYNLVQYLGELGELVEVHRNDRISLQEVSQLGASGIVISPGPCTPDEAGVSMAVVTEFGRKIPILGVCLGHQSICQAYGGIIRRADKLMHGKTSMIDHDGSGLFGGISNPFRATRYHSLVADKTSLPKVLQVNAWSDDGEIMAVQHNEFPVYGVQFHPESIVSEHGHDILAAFLDVCRMQKSA